MIELPEAATIARQMQNELPGKRIRSCTTNDSPHKFAFFTPSAGEFPARLEGTLIRQISHNGRGFIQAELDDGQTLQWCEMGGRILFKPAGETPPKKHQLLLTFDDGSSLTVSLVLWGMMQIADSAEIESNIPKRPAPLADWFTYDRFEELLADPTERESRSVKAFMISKPGLGGVANGCLQDILFNAGIHPKRRMVSLNPQELHNLYTAMRSTLTQMVDGGGRDSERDLYDRPGGYRCILGSHAQGQLCPVCGRPIQKIQYLGGASYYCPVCQV